MEKTEITIDAANKKLGRVASDIALALRGKKSPTFAPHKTNTPKVLVKNVDSISFSERRLKDTYFVRYSGYPGGKKDIPVSDVLKKDPRDVLEHAVSGMIPKNKLHKNIMKQLTMYHGEDK
jgi:large subunit ribosomal protein L13